MNEYVITLDKAIIAGPWQWNAATFSNAIARKGHNISLARPAPAGDIDLGSGLVVRNLGPRPACDPRIQSVACTSDGFVLVDRPLAEIKARLVAQLKSRTGQTILEKAPDYKQRNAALGLLAMNETEAILAHIAACRAICDAAEVAIAAAETGAEAAAVLDGVVFP